MRVAADTHRARLLAVVAACALVGSACGNSATPTVGPGATAGPNDTQGLGSAAPDGSTAAVDLFPSSATLNDMNAKEEADVRAMREELGLQAVLGADTGALLDFIESAQERFARKVQPDVLRLLGLDTAAAAAAPAAAASGHGATLAAFHSDHPAAGTPEAVDVAPGSLRDQVTTWTGLGLLIIPKSDEKLSGSLDKTEKASGTVGESQVDQTSSLHIDLTTGEGSISFLVKIDSSTTTTLNGAVSALVNGTGTGGLKVNSCPDESGTVTGSVEVKISELASAAGATSSTDLNVHADFTLSVNSAAKLSAIQVHTTTYGGGIAAGKQWTAGGTSTFGGGSPATSSATNATPAQAARVTDSAAYAAWAVAGIAGEAENFWRSGKCVDLHSSVESKTVQPKEKVAFTVDPRGKWDGKPISAGVDVTFSGKETLDPNGGTLPPPVSFTYTAGEKKDDAGTVSLQQTSNRGIGRKSITFTVGDADYKVNYGGGYVYNGTKCKGLAGAWTLQITVGGGTGTVTFTIPASLGPAVATTNYKLSIAGTNNTYKMKGTVTPSTDADGKPFLVFAMGAGTITQKSKNGTITLPFTDPTTDNISLEAGSFCTT